MKVLCLADIHGDIPAVKKAAEYAKRNGINHALILGDFPSHGAFRNIELSTKAVKDSFMALEGLQVMAIPGNCDLADSPSLFDELGINLHKKTIELEGWTIAGFGGSNITPFDTPFEMDEDEMYAGLRDLLAPLARESTILAVHCPPKDTNCDMNYAGTHAGSSGIRKAIEEFSPHAVLCSHIHESGGLRDEIGKSLIANIGPAGKGRAGIIELGKSIEISLQQVF